jgi:hypothetical protein
MANQRRRRIAKWFERIALLCALFDIVGNPLYVSLSRLQSHPAALELADRQSGDPESAKSRAPASAPRARRGQRCPSLHGRRRGPNSASLRQSQRPASERGRHAGHDDSTKDRRHLGTRRW